MAATQDLGADVWACGPEDLAVVGGRVSRPRPSDPGCAPRHRGGDHRWVVDSGLARARSSERLIDVAADVDVTLLRIDPPVDARYLHTTYLLDLVGPAAVRVVNRPAGIRALHEKLVALRFPNCAPRPSSPQTQTTSAASSPAHGTAVVKPVDGFAGLDVWLLRDDAPPRRWPSPPLAAVRRHVIAQEYLADGRRAATSDCSSSTARSSALCCGARRPTRLPDRPARRSRRGRRRGPTHRRRTGSALAAHGIVLAGLDVIAGRLIEVNVTCPGGMHKTDALLGTDLSGAIVRRLLVTAPAHRKESPHEH